LTAGVGRGSPLRAFAAFLPTPKTGEWLTLGEGWTPLVKSVWVGPRLGVPNLWFKLDHLNPTGSYKDRFAAMQVSLYRAQGVSACMATTSGNTGAALAACCALAGIRCAIFVRGGVPAGKLVQMRAYGAQVYRLDDATVTAGGRDVFFQVLRDASRAHGVPLVTSAYAVCPDGMEGVKTIAYEIVDEIGMPSDVFVPVGGGGMCVAIGRGFADLVRAGRVAARGAGARGAGARGAVGQGGGARGPRMHAVQPAGNDTLVTRWKDGHATAREVLSTTRISGLAVGVDLDASRVIGLLRETGGTGVLVEDEATWQAQHDLCRHEGIYVEPAGAASVAGLARAVAAHGFRAEGPVVCLLTGHGFKDPDAAARMAGGADIDTIEPSQIPAAIGR
jgi:threonine synthase